MAYDKAVDSEKLETGLTTLANAIREKGGTSAPLEFPQGMADAVAAIEGGGIPGDTSLADFLSSPESARGVKNSEVVDLRFAFFGDKLQFIDLPNAKTMPHYYAFKNCNLTTIDTVNLPLMEVIEIESFEYNSDLSEIDLPAAKKINYYAFYGDRNLKKLILRRKAVVELLSAASNIFSGTPIINKQGYVYVPKAMVDQYKVATNWAEIADQIRAIEDYPQEVTSNA